MPLPHPNISQIPTLPKPAAIPSLWNLRYDEIDANFAYLLGLVTGLGSASSLIADIDGTLAANSDARVATQKAVKTYISNAMAANDAMVYKGAINCSANPNYPAADCGHTYRASVAGKIGGAAGVSVEIGDFITCLVDGTVSGNQATVGSSWQVIQANLDGAALLSVAQAWTKGQCGTPAPFPNTIGGISLDLSQANNWEVTLTGNIVLANPSSMPVGQAGVLRIVNGAAPYTIAYGSYFKSTYGSLPALTAAAGAVDLLPYYVETATRIWIGSQGDSK